MAGTIETRLLQCQVPLKGTSYTVAGIVVRRVVQTEGGAGSTAWQLGGPEAPDISPAVENKGDEAAILDAFLDAANDRSS